MKTIYWFLIGFVAVLSWIYYELVNAPHEDELWGNWNDTNDHNTPDK